MPLPSGGLASQIPHCHGIRNKVVHIKVASGDSGAVEPFRLKFQKFMKEKTLA